MQKIQILNLLFIFYAILVNVKVVNLSFLILKTSEIAVHKPLIIVRNSHLMECSMPGLPVRHQLPESTQTHVH